MPHCVSVRVPPVCDFYGKLAQAGLTTCPVSWQSPSCAEVISADMLRHTLAPLVMCVVPVVGLLPMCLRALRIHVTCEHPHTERL